MFSCLHHNSVIFGIMKIYIACLIIILYSCTSSPVDQVTVQQDENGMKLVVNGNAMMVNGMNWDYVPIGTTITDRDIWKRSDKVIKAALQAEMTLLKDMGVNAIRAYHMEPKWISYIYHTFGIYTMINITFGAYGLDINGVSVPKTDYANEETKIVLMNEAKDMALKYKDTPGLLLYMIGNENNYHLTWEGAETEDIPNEEKTTQTRKAARALYKAFNDAAKEVKAIDQSHPVAICNGDLLYIDLVKEECTDIDIYGTNMYRGKSFADAFTRVQNELGLPMLLTEFGSDAYNARDDKEDQLMQAYYVIENWREIYQNAAGIGKTNNCLGGFTFQFSDGWWKYNQKENLDIHDNNASWSSNGYNRDQVKPGDKNMNEEWFGICAKGPTNSMGLYELFPRAAFYALQVVHQLNPYDSGMTLNKVTDHFDNIEPMEALIKAQNENWQSD